MQSAYGIRCDIRGNIKTGRRSVRFAINREGQRVGWAMRPRSTSRANRDRAATFTQCFLEATFILRTHLRVKDESLH